MGQEEFFSAAKTLTQQFFATITPDSIIRHVSHLDADGLSSAAIVVAALHNNKYCFSTTILPTLDGQTAPNMVQDAATHYIISDLGSGQLKVLVEALGDKPVLILDHHEIEEGVELPATWCHVNPHLFGVNGSTEISGSGVSYACMQHIVEDKNTLLHLALLGATGDVQRKPEFIGVNASMFRDALTCQRVREVTTLNAFGISSKPLHYILEWNDAVQIPGVTKVRGGGTQFLEKVGISPEIGGRPVMYEDLSPVEKEKLASSIITARQGMPDAEDIFFQQHVLPFEEKGRSTRTLQEYSTLLNACGRMKKYSIGIGACLRDAAVKQLAFVIEDAYKKKIGQSIKWYKERNHESGQGYLIIDGGREIPATMIGTLASIVSRQKDVQDGTYIVACAENDDGQTKVSVRIKGETEDIDLRTVAQQLCEGFDAQAGGHSFAAGAVFSSDFRQKFLENVRKRFSADVL